MRSILVEVHAATEPDQGQFVCHQHGNLSPRFHRRALPDSVSNCLSSEPTFPCFEHWGPAKLKAFGESLQPEATAVADLPTRSLLLFDLFVLLPLPPSTPLGLCIGPEERTVTSASGGCHVQDLQKHYEGTSVAFCGADRWACRLHPTCRSGWCGGRYKSQNF